MPPSRHRPDPLLAAAAKPKKDPLKVSSSTSVDLLTEVSIAKRKFDADRDANTTNAIARGPRPQKKKTLWSSQNKGVEKRGAKDQQYETINAVSTSELAQARRGLERKALQYERMKRGWTKDLTDSQREEILVDFESKYLDALETGAVSGEEDDDDTDDPLVEVVDEFGRTRMVKQTRVTRPLSPESDTRPANLIYGDYMPTFTPDAEKAWEINNREDRGPSPSPPPFSKSCSNIRVVEETHYNPNAEIRTRGVGHYTFSADEATRQEQMAALNEARDETETQRVAAKKAAEVRRQKIEDRRKEIAGKKRKREADRFLSELGLELGAGDGGN